jgi:hypothetical protein
VNLKFQLKFGGKRNRITSEQKNYWILEIKKLTSKYMKYGK